MSTIRANSITNSAGTGAPDFPNGVSVGGSAVTATAAELNVLDGITAIASQAEAEAGTSSTTLMTPQRAKQAINALVGAANAGLAAGAVGSYAFLARGVTAAITAGTTYAGSDLRYAALYSGSFGGTTGAVQMSSAGSYVTGTWMALGSNGATNYPIAVFLRVA